MVKLTDTEYVEAEGSNCPYCRSVDLLAHLPEMEAGKIEVQEECLDCDRQWWAVYKLTGWEPRLKGGGLS